MTLNKSYHMYDMDIDVIFKDLNNKLFCTFTSADGLEPLIEDISQSYTVMYNKMFVLFVKSTNEYVVTYNVDTAKMRWDSELGTVVLGMYDQVPNELGFKSFWLVKNQTGSR